MWKKSIPLTVLSVVALIGFGPVSHAESLIQYTWVELDYVDGETRNVVGTKDAEGEGGRLAASWGFADRFYVQGSYVDIDFSDHFTDPSTGSAVDLDTGQEWRLGFGVHTELNETTDGYLQLDYVNQEFDSRCCGSTDDSTWAVSVGTRSLPVKWFEWQLAVTFLENYVLTDSGQIGASLALRYHIAVGISANLGYQYASDINNWNLGVRWGF